MPTRIAFPVIGPVMQLVLLTAVLSRVTQLPGYPASSSSGDVIAGLDAEGSVSLDEFDLAADPLVLVGVVGLLALVALLASGVPAVRATRVGPLEALRGD